MKGEEGEALSRRSQRMTTWRPGKRKRIKRAFGNKVRQAANALIAKLLGICPLARNSCSSILSEGFVLVFHFRTKFISLQSATA
jgi:hypothetical protein